MVRRARRALLRTAGPGVGACLPSCGFVHTRSTSTMDGVPLLQAGGPGKGGPHVGPQQLPDVKGESCGPQERCRAAQKAEGGAQAPQQPATLCAVGGQAVDGAAAGDAAGTTVPVRREHSSEKSSQGRVAKRAFRLVSETSDGGTSSCAAGSQLPSGSATGSPWANRCGTLARRAALCCSVQAVARLSRSAAVHMSWHTALLLEERISQAAPLRVTPAANRPSSCALAHWGAGRPVLCELVLCC